LYNGTTLLLRQDWGASYLIAVSFKNYVSSGTTSLPNHFKHCNGS
jgi:hypothetical protein